MPLLINKLEISKTKKKKYIKNIERHLRNYNNYKIGITNLKRQLSYPVSFLESSVVSLESKEIPPYKELINNKLKALQILVESIEHALIELTGVEIKYVEYRYFNGWTITKCALEIGYSDKSLFNIRNQIMDKFIISLGGLVYIK